MLEPLPGDCDRVSHSDSAGSSQRDFCASSQNDCVCFQRDYTVFSQNDRMSL